MENKAIRMFTIILAAVLCMATVPVTVYARGVDPHPQPLPEEMEKPATGGIETEPKDVPITPKDNTTLVDGFFEDRQLVTVTTKAGNCFYILINRANEDKETAVHFLNRMDDADPQTLLKDGETKSEHCTRTTKCKVGAVNTNCSMCRNNMNTCIGSEPEEHRPEETKPQEEKPNGIGDLMVFLAVVLAGGGAVLYFFKFRKPKADIKGGDDLDEYNFEGGEDDEEEVPEPDDAQKPGEDWLIEKKVPELSKENER